MKAMLLAAGLGTRFQPHTLKKAKPALPFLNLPMVYYSTMLLNQLGVKNFVYNTFHLPDSIRKALQASEGSSAEIKDWLSDLTFQESSDGNVILGSAGGLKKAENSFDGEQNFILMNADEIILPANLSAFENLVTTHAQSSRLATLAVMKHAEVGKQFGGIWCDENHRVIEIGKTPSRPGLTAWHFIGLQVLNSRIFSMIEAGKETNIFYDVMNPLLAKHEVYAHPVQCHWFETGNLQSYLHATEECLKLMSLNRSSYLNGLLTELRPEDSLQTVNGQPVYGNPAFQLACKQAILEGFAVGWLPQNAKVPSFNSRILSRVVFDHNPAVLPTDMKNNLIL